MLRYCAANLSHSVTNGMDVVKSVEGVGSTSGRTSQPVVVTVCACILRVGQCSFVLCACCSRYIVHQQLTASLFVSCYFRTVGSSPEQHTLSDEPMRGNVWLFSS